MSALYGGMVVETVAIAVPSGDVILAPSLPVLQVIHVPSYT